MHEQSTRQQSQQQSKVPNQTPTSMISRDNNLMPSMVVKQQKNQLQSLFGKCKDNDSATKSTTSKEDLDESSRPKGLNGLKGREQIFDQDGLILPRRIAYSSQYAVGQQRETVRDLSRELKFNQARGNNVLDKKSELKKAMEKLEANRKRKEAEQERLTRRTSLELRLEERAERLARDSEQSGGGGGG